MHELSIANSIVEILQQNVPESDLKNVKTVRLKVGAMSGVVPECLDFLFTAAAEQSPLRCTKLAIQRIPFTIECSSCQKISENAKGLVICPACGSVKTQILSGTELEIVEIELLDSPTEAP